MSAVLHRWDLALDAFFFLGLQLFAINAAAALVFWFSGLRPGAAEYYNGKKWVTVVSGVATAAALAGLLFLQFANTPALQRASRSQAAIPVVERAIENSGLAHPLQVKASFPRPHPNAGNALLIEASVYRDPSAAGTDDDIRAALARGIERSVRDSAFGADPYVVIDLAAGRP